MAKRLFFGLILFVELALAALLVIAIRHGRFDQGAAFFVYVYGALAALALAAGFALPAQWSRRAGAHGLLMLGCVVFAMPFVWLVSTSFKYEEEVFVDPPKWVPSIPSVVERSPYLTGEEVAPVERPVSISAERWEMLWPRLESAIWERARARLGDGRANQFPEPQVRPLIVRGVWMGVATRLPAGAWDSDATALTAVAGRVDPESVETAWEAIHRGVTLRLPTVTDTDLVTQRVGSSGSGWTSLDEHVRTIAAGSNEMTDFAYDFTDTATGAVVGEFTLPFASEQLFSITLPLRPDRSWHELRVVLEIGGTRYTLEDRLYLGQRRWQEFTFKLKHLDDRDERDLGVYPLVRSADAAPPSEQKTMRLRLTVVKTDGLGAAWRKLTHSYSSAYLATEHRWSYIANSAYLVVLTVLGQLVSCSMVAYAFARLHWPGREVMFVLLLATLMLPAQVTMVPVFIVFKHLGWYNTLEALWVPSFFGSAFFIFMLRQFMKGIPVELEEAARIDGCSVFGIYWRLILPLVRPALAAVAIFTFMNTWNDFMGPLIYINDQRLYPLSLGLFEFRTEHGTDYGMLMAASTLMTLPVIVLFFLAQRYFIEGVTLTGMKA